MEHSNNEEIPSTPATPGTPGVPLFGGFKSERNGNGSNKNKKSLLKNCKCFSVQDWTIEDGALPTVSCSLMPPPPVPLAKKIGAEFIGTLILIFAGTATAIVNQKTKGSETLIGCAASSGLAVMIVILSTGHISGAHLNPAVGELAGIAVGATVMLNILIAGPITGGSMNPVRSLGPAIAANNYKAIWVYLLAPIIGALGGAGTYTAVKLPQEDDNAKANAPSNPASFRR